MDKIKWNDYVAHIDKTDVVIYKKGRGEDEGYLVHKLNIPHHIIMKLMEKI